jgi:glucose-6-phosphate-specific signal transduction histidine kinase
LHTTSSTAARSGPGTDEAARVDAPATAYTGTTRERLEIALATLEALRESEQRALGRTLHDDLGSVLTALGMRLAILFRRGPGDARHAGDVVEIKSLLADVTRTVHRLQAGLRPASLDHFGMGPAIEAQLAECERLHGVRCRFAASQDEPHGADAAGLAALFAQFQDGLGMLLAAGSTDTVDVALAPGNTALTLALTGRDYPVPSTALVAIEERAARAGIRVQVDECTATRIGLRFAVRTTR